MPEKDKTYIGDGVVVWYDGYHVVLETEVARIYLNEYTLEMLQAWLKTKYAAALQAANKTA